MKRLSLYGCMFLIILLTANLYGNKKIIIAVSDDYVPFSDVNEKGELWGFDVDISYALCKAMNATCELVVVDWQHIISGLVAGKYDAIIASMGKTPEREKLIDFTDKYYHSNSSFVGRANIGLTISPENLKGKKLAAVAGTLQADYLKDHYHHIAKIILTETTEKAFELLVKGEIDLVLEADFPILEFLKSERGKPFDFIGDPIVGVPSSTAHIVVRKGDNALKNAFNKAILDIRSNGEYSRINRKYFPFDIY